MPRLARIVSHGVPHHVTQRGNRVDDVAERAQQRAAQKIKVLGILSARSAI